MCCWQNPVCLNKTLEAALNFRPPSNSKRSAGSVPAWKLVNPANKDSTASPAVMRKTLAAVLEMSLLLRGPSHCMHLPCLKSRAVLLALQAPGSPALLTKSVCGGKEQSSWEPSLAPCRIEPCSRQAFWLWKECFFFFFCVPGGRMKVCVHFPAYPLCKRGLAALESGAHLEAP